MSDSGRRFEAPEYDVPNILRSMGTMLRGPRGQYSTNFTDVFSSDREEQYQYVNGLLAVMVSLFIFFAFWVFVLCVLKFRGDDVGCASGQAFLTKRNEDEDVHSTDDDDGSFLSSIGSASQPSIDPDDENSVTKLTSHAKETSSNDSLEDFFEKGRAPPTNNMTRPDDNTSFDDSNNSFTRLRLSRVNQRERRTRFCFLLVGLLSLVSVPVIFVTSFGPLKEAAGATDELVLLARDLLLQLNTTVYSIEDATASATEAIESTELDVGKICPNVDVSYFKESIGVDLNTLVSSITEDYEAMLVVSEEKVEFVRNFVETFDEGLTQFENSIAKAEEWMWLVPAVLFAVSILTASTMLGVILAWRRKSGKRIQNTMSYFVLPLLMVTTVACWLIIISASLGTMVGSDICTASTSKGSPDDTIQQILYVLNVDQNSTTYELVQAYTNQCIGPSPTEEIEEVRLVVQEIIDLIWQQISQIDSIGRAQIMETCGGNELESLLLTARNLAKILTSIRRSLDSASSSLSCPRINPVYSAVAHETVCTEAAAAVSSGFFMFLALGLSLLIMISLRASWLQNITEEKVYHDESEVAENMILDEHEEYLAYISKYKHEWQEYRGFDENAMSHSASMDDDGSFSERSEGSIYFEENDDYRSDGEGYNGSMEGSDGDSEFSSGGLHGAVLPSKLKQASSQTHGTESSDEISLPNLEAQKSVASASITEEDFFNFPTSMLPPPGNPDYQQATNEFITASVQSRLTQQASKSSMNDDGKIKRRPSKSSNIDARSTLSRQSSKSSQEASKSSVSREARISRKSSKSSIKSGDKKSNNQASVEHTTSDQAKRSSNFFERYGIDPGCSVRRKADKPSTPPLATTNRDPPTADNVDQPSVSRTLSAKTSSQRAVSQLQTAQAHPLPQATISRLRPSVPSGRTFFKTNPTGSMGEMEIQLHRTPYSPRGDPPTKADFFEC